MTTPERLDELERLVREVQEALAQIQAENKALRAAANQADANAIEARAK